MQVNHLSCTFESGYTCNFNALLLICVTKLHAIASPVPKATFQMMDNCVFLTFYFYFLHALQTPPTQPAPGRRWAGEAANPTIGRRDWETSGVTLHEADC